MTTNIHTLSNTHFSSSTFAKALCLTICFAGACVRAEAGSGLVISEVMADPSPVVGLPDAEYLELYNAGPETISLAKYRLVYGSRSAFLPEFALLPGDYAIVCHTSSENLFSRFGNVIGLANFNLPNDGADLSILSPEGSVVFHLRYALTWWPESKRAGGYALEIVDPADFCGGLPNWKVSQHPDGGTPGRANTHPRGGPNAEASRRYVERVELPSPHEIRLLFSGKLDSTSIASADWHLTHGNILKTTLRNPSFTEISIEADGMFNTGSENSLSVRGLRSCNGEQVPEQLIPLANSLVAQPGDIVISEILFNPLPDGIDFVEIHNRGKSFINLKNYTLANLRADLPNVVRTITTDNVLISPGDYIALTQDPDLLRQHYPAETPRRFIRMASLPAFVNTTGGAIIHTGEGLEVDKLSYTEKFHHVLISNPKGVSLELTNPDTNNAAERFWHSASSGTGYATPGYQNSQHHSGHVVDAIHLVPEVITPDGDDSDDFSSITYSFGTHGRILSISVFDHRGRRIRTLVKDQIAAVSGSIPWDGRNDQGEIVPTGHYLIFVNAFDLTGKKSIFKKKIVVIR